MDRLGQYDIIGPLGSGGMGEVYHAYDTRLCRRVAIKVLIERLSSDRDARERLRREAVAAASLDHPYICKVFEIAEADGLLFIVMEYVEGETLHGKSFLLPEVLRLGGEMSEALGEAHKRGFVHRDLKPSNVMVTTQGHAKVLDFGLAKRVVVTARNQDDITVTTDGSPITSAGQSVGTPSYMSPEQAAGDTVDQRSDQFSMGILLCEMATGRHPFRRASARETMAAVLRDSPEIAGDLPPGLVVLLRRLMAKAPEDRYTGMTEVREILARIAAGDIAVPGPDSSRLPVIGRDTEREELRRAMVEATGGQGSLVLIGGEPGIGKTHLTQDLIAEARRSGCLALIGHCYEMEGAPPYVPFIEVIEYAARVLQPSMFRHAIGDAAPEVAKLMPELRRMFPEIPAAAELPPEQQRRFLFNSVREFIERACLTTPQVVLLEDLHWADEPTLQLLYHLAPAFASLKILVIGTYRDGDLDASPSFQRILDSLLRSRLATRISLRRLTAESVQTMLATLSGKAPPAAVARLIFEATEGNPFFVEEVYRHLSEEGRLLDDAGEWRLGLRADDLQVPEGVRLVIAHRLARLSDDARRVLTTAAVVGRTFGLPLLEALESSRPDAALEAVEEAERAQLVSAEPGGREPRYRFVHELVRQTLAETLSLPRRQRLHARVADAIERTFPTTVETHASAIALHLYQAGAAADPEKTTRYLGIAARRALEGAAHEEALSLVERALSLWEGESSARVADLLEQRGAAQRSLGRHDEAQQTFAQAIDMFAQIGRGSQGAAICLNLALMYSWRADRPRVMAAMGQAKRLLGDDDEVLRCRMMLMEAFGASVAGAVLPAAALLDAAQSIARRLAIPALEASAAWVEAGHSLHTLQIERGLVAGRRAAEAARAQGDLWLLSELEYIQINTMLISGQTEASAKLAREAAVRAERIGNRNAYWLCNFLMGWIHLAQGDLPAAERAADQSFEISRSLQTVIDFWNHVLRGAILSARRGPAAAVASFRQALDREPPTCFRGTSAAHLFAALAEAGDPEALDFLERHPPLLPVAGQINTMGSWTALELTIAGLAALDRTAQLAPLYPLTEQFVAAGGWSHSRGMFQTAAGTAAAAGENWSRAEEHHRTAIHQADTAPFRVSQPQARESYAAMLRARGGEGDRARARVLFAEALAMYESLGMPWHAKQLSARRALT